jgi:hypothetical protein
MLSAAAFAAAKYENPSMKNYQGGQETVAGGYVDKIVTTYLNVRTNMSIMSMVWSPYAYLSQTGRIEVTKESERQAKGGFSSTTIVEDPTGDQEMPRLRTRTPTPEKNSTSHNTPAH